jgi:hypothetical protein
MLHDAQPTQWSAMIQGLVRHYATLWHASDTCLPWLGPPYTSGAQRSNERDLDQFLATVSAELKCAPQTDSQQQAKWARIGLAFRNVARATLEANERAGHAPGVRLPRSDDRVCPDGPPLRSGDHQRCVNLLLIDSAGRSAQLYPRP